MAEAPAALAPAALATVAALALAAPPLGDDAPPSLVRWRNGRAARLAAALAPVAEAPAAEAPVAEAPVALPPVSKAMPTPRGCTWVQVAGDAEWPDGCYPLPLTPRPQTTPVADLLPKEEIESEKEDEQELGLRAQQAEDSNVATLLALSARWVEEAARDATWILDFDQNENPWSQPHVDPNSRVARQLSWQRRMLGIGGSTDDQSMEETLEEEEAEEEDEEEEEPEEWIMRTTTGSYVIPYPPEEVRGGKKQESEEEEEAEDEESEEEAADKESEEEDEDDDDGNRGTKRKLMTDPYME